MFGKADIEPALKKIQKITFGGYTGNKRKVLKNLWTVMEEDGIVFDSFFDAFSGSSVVSLFMKFMGKRVVANDFLTSSYLNAAMLVENPGYYLSEDEMNFLVNNQIANPKSGFIYSNFKDVRFTEQECFELDRFRVNMELVGSKFNGDRLFDLENCKPRFEQLKTVESKLPKEWLGMGKEFSEWFLKYNGSFENSIIYSEDRKKHLAIASAVRMMNLTVLKNCFIGGRYHKGQVIANLDHRLGHKMHKGVDNVEFTKIFLSDYYNPKYDILYDESYQPCQALNCDIMELLQNTDFTTDVMYLDPPYGGSSTDYAHMYQFMEEYVYGKKMDEIDHVAKYGKRFVDKKTYEDHFLKMLELSERFPTWVVSYNDSSWETKDHIVGLLKQFRKNVTVHEVDNYVYKYRSEQKEKTGIEYIFIAKK
jgi:adenine-specific DNA-methyltransferase